MFLDVASTPRPAFIIFRSPSASDTGTVDVSLDGLRRRPLEALAVLTVVALAHGLAFVTLHDGGVYAIGARG